MTDVQQRALDLLNESRIAFGLAKTDVFFRDQTPENEALCRALERQEPAMTSELRPAVECELCAKLTSDIEQSAARTAAQIGAVMQCRECGRVYETQAAELAKWKALAETLAGALDWYEKQANDCRKITSEGDNARYALDRDGGERARQALTSYKEQRDA